VILSETKNLKERVLSPRHPLNPIPSPIVGEGMVRGESLLNLQKSSLSPFLFRVRIVTRQLNHYDKWLLPDVRDLDGDGLDC